MTDLLTLAVAVDVCLPGQHRVTVTGESVCIATQFGIFDLKPVDGLPDNFTVSILTHDEGFLVLAPSFDEPVPLLRALTYVRDEIAQGLRMSLIRSV